MITAQNSHQRLEITEGARADVRRIIAEVCGKYNLSPTELLSQRRSREVSWPRQEVMWRAKKETAASLPLIGKMLGGLDHTTVIHGVRRHEQRIAGANEQG